MTSTHSELLTLSEAEKSFGIPRWCLRRWIDAGELAIAPDQHAAAIKCLHDKGLSMQRIANELGITKATVQRRLEGAHRKDLIVAADVERLAAQPAFCLGCGKPIEPGRQWHPNCASRQPGAAEKRSAAWDENRKTAARARMTGWWSDDARREQQSERKRQMHAAMRQAFDSYKTSNGLLDIAELVEALGQVGWRERISVGRVRALASQYSVGVRVGGFAGRARFAFTSDEVDQIRQLLKTETKDGHCVDCGKPTYASVRCSTCYNALRGTRLQALHEHLNAQLAGFKHEHGLHDLRDVAQQLDRSRTKIWAWARKLGVGTRVPSVLGLPERWLLSDTDIAAIQQALNDLATRSTPDGMANIRDSTRYPDWYRKRFKTTAKFGEYATAIARERGVKVGRPTELLHADERQILALAAEGVSQRAIAARVGVSRGQVQRLLKRHVA